MSATAGFGAAHSPTLQGLAVERLWFVFLLTGIAVAVIVYGLILWSVIAYRRRSDALPPQFRENVPLEIAYTLIPLLIVAGLFVLTYRTEAYVDRVAQAGDPVSIRVTGFRWSWLFEYEGAHVSVQGTPDHPPEMVVPTGEPVRITVVSTDVMHAFYVPAFLYKRDAFPGLTNRFEVTVRDPGTYLGECAEFCGLDHARMLFTVRAVPPGEFRHWLEQARRGGPVP